MFFADEDDFYRLADGDLIAGAITISQVLTIAFEDQAETRLAINGRFSLHVPNRKPQLLTVEEPIGLGVLCVILRDRVKEISANKSSADLDVYFVSGVHLHVSAATDYESWELYNSLGFKLIALPGGEVGYWKMSNSKKPE